MDTNKDKGLKSSPEHQKSFRHIFRMTSNNGFTPGQTLTSLEGLSYMRKPIFNIMPMEIEKQNVQFVHVRIKKNKFHTLENVSRGPNT